MRSRRLSRPTCATYVDRLHARFSIHADSVFTNARPVSFRSLRSFNLSAGDTVSDVWRGFSLLLCVDDHRSGDDRLCHRRVQWQVFQRDRDQARDDWHLPGRVQLLVQVCSSRSAGYRCHSLVPFHPAQVDFCWSACGSACHEKCDWCC